MKKINALTAIIALFGVTSYHYPAYAETVPLNWIQMEMTEEQSDTPIVTANSKDTPITERVRKILYPDGASVPMAKPQAAVSNTTENKPAGDSSNDLTSAIEEIKKRRQEEDLLLSNLLRKQKEQEESLKQQEHQKLLTELAALQKKQKEEENQKLATILQELKQQQLQQQTEQNKNVLDLMNALKQQQMEQQQAAQLQSTWNPMSSPVRIIPASVADDAQDVKKTVQEYISDNIQDATEAPSREADIAFFYSPGALYKIYCKEGFVTDLQLQPGEEIQYVGGGDTTRWVIDKAQSGAGNNKAWHIYLKPMKSGMETNIVITTDKHSYQLQVKSTNWYTPIITWRYPQEEKAAFYRAQAKQQKLEDDSISLAAISPDALSFNYRITKDRSYAWTPQMVFDDGSKTYIKMPASMSNSAAPVLFVKEGKKLILVNYRVKNGSYVVDRLFKEAELRNGNESIRIKRT